MYILIYLNCCQSLTKQTVVQVTHLQQPSHTCMNVTPSSFQSTHNSILVFFPLSEPIWYWSQLLPWYCSDSRLLSYSAAQGFEWPVISLCFSSVIFSLRMFNTRKSVVFPSAGGLRNRLGKYINAFGVTNSPCGVI